MDTVTSADGTTIAYDTHAPGGGGGADGARVVIVGGASNDRLVWVPLGQALAGLGLTAIAYDRRGRGDSTDHQPYAVEREIEDLAAVIEAVGTDGRAHVFAMSSGGSLAYRAAAAGAPMTSLATLETPYRVAGAPQPPPDYADHLAALLAQGRRGDMVEYFQVAGVGMPQAVVDQQKGTPAWDWLSGIAQTLLYDGLCLGGNDHALPTGLLSSVTIPVLSIYSHGSPPFLQDAATAAAEALPNGKAAGFEGGFHSVPVETLAPALAAFYTGEGQRAR